MNLPVKQVFFGLLTLGLTACPQVLGTPRVLSIDPQNGATEIPVNVTVRAELGLPDGQIDVSTLTEGSVSLTDAAGTPVSAERTVTESTLIVDPTTDLEPGSTYTFVVNSSLQTENGVPVTGDSSTFTTAPSGDQIPDGGLTAERERVVFSAGGASSQDTRTLTLSNSSTETLEVSGAIEGDAAAQFNLADSSFSLEAGASRTLELTFTPSGLGPQLATLVLTSDGSPTLNVALGGLGIEGQGGNLEPSLQWILDTYELPVDSGDDDPTSTPLVDSKVNGFVGDEVSAQTFSKASPTEPVTVEVLAAFGVENDPVLEFGYYAAGSAAARTELFTVEQDPGLNEQRLAPELTLSNPASSAEGGVTFDPGSESFGFYSFWPTNRFFGERTVYTEDKLNTFADAIPHQVRAYPLLNPDGTTEPNAYVLATEEFTKGFDYNDVVVVVRNVTPGTDTPITPPGGSIPGLQITTPLGLPYSDRLVLHYINDTTGNLCDPTVDLTCDPDAEQWTEIVFRNTGVVRLQNTGSGALQLSLSISGSNMFVLPNGETSLTLSPGDSFDLTVQFAPGNLGDKGVYPGTLNIQTGEEKAGFGLAGIFMPKPEGGREVYLGGLINKAFGYQTDLDTNSGLSDASPDAPLAGDEVRAAYWRAADASEPVVATQLAAFHSCCRAGEPFELWAQGAGGPSARMRHDRVYSQTIYPSLPGESGAAQLSATVAGSFEIRVAGYSTDPSKGKGAGNLGVRLWPLKDAAGRAVANTYIVAQDFVEKGCGTSEVANCDYNDNLFVVSNIAPTN